MRRLALAFLLATAACAGSPSPLPSSAPSSAAISPPSSPAGSRVVEVDRAASFRAVIGALEGKQCGAMQCELRMAGAPDRHVPVTLSTGSTASSSSSGLGLLAIVVADGISLKGRGGNVAPGCAETGPGLAIPRRDGTHDLAALRSCARRLKEATPEFMADRAIRVTANADVSFSDLLGTIEALRGEKGDLFPDVSLERSWPVSRP